MVKCWLIPSLNLITLIITSVDIWSTLDQHLNMQSVESWLIFMDTPLRINQYMRCSALGRLSTNCHSSTSIDKVSIEVLIKYWSRIDWDVHRALIEISTECWSRINWGDQSTLNHWIRCPLYIGSDFLSVHVPLNCHYHQLLCR